MERDHGTEMGGATSTPAVATSAKGEDKTIAAASGAPSYRSWKKKFQKMRYVFEDKMAANEKLHTQEVKAIQTSKRLAVEIDRILDLLLDVNNSPQIPAARRIDLSLPPSGDAEHRPSLAFDKKDGWNARFYDKKDKEHPYPSPPAKRLQSLLAQVPHTDLAAARLRNPALLRDLVVSAADEDPSSPSSPSLDSKLAFVVPRGTTPQALYPESFLSADDIDNYLWEVDRTIAGRALVKGGKPPPMLPTLAPFALTADMHTTAGDRGWTEFFNKSILTKDLPSIYSVSPLTTTRDTILRNPTSVYNWLKKHAPKSIFLQEGEATAQAAAAAAASSGENGDDGRHHHRHDGSHHTPGGRGQNGTSSSPGASAWRGRKSAGAESASSRKSESGTGTGRKPMGAISGGRWAAQQRKRASAAMAAAAAADAAAAAAAASGGGGGGSGRDGSPASSRQAGDELDAEDVTIYMATPRTMAQSSDRPSSGGTKRGRASTGSTTASARGTKRKRKSDGGADGKDSPTPTASAGGSSTKRARKSGGGRSSHAAAEADEETEVDGDADEADDAGEEMEVDNDGGADADMEAASEEAASKVGDDVASTPAEA